MITFLSLSLRKAQRNATTTIMTTLSIHSNTISCYHNADGVLPLSKILVCRYFSASIQNRGSRSLEIRREDNGTDEEDVECNHKHGPEAAVSKKRDKDDPVCCLFESVANMFGASAVMLEGDLILVNCWRTIEVILRRKGVSPSL